MRFTAAVVLLLALSAIVLAAFFSPFLREPDVTGMGFAYRETIKAAAAGVAAAVAVGATGWLVARFSKPEDKDDPGEPG